MKPRLLEKYYSVGQLAFAYEYDEKSIRRKILKKEFGEDVLKLGGSDWRVPMSGVLFFEQNNRVFADHEAAAPDLSPVVARTEGELRRKVTGVTANGGKGEV
jgi:hypothetical protein